MAKADVKVLVTGGSGYIGSWCVKLCLDAGYTVHTTVRTASKAEFLKKLDGATDRLKIFDGVDLLAPGAFDAPVAGCEAVLHTASPFFIAGGTEDNLVKPAVEGTRTVLQSCTKAGVKKVVLTSSIAAITNHGGAYPKDTPYSSEMWSDEKFLRERNNFYSLSKTVAEKVAWEMSKEAGCPWKLATTNPCTVLGPQLPGIKDLGTTMAQMVMYMDGTLKKIDDQYLSLVDVRDVAQAHVNAIEKEDAFGKRFLLIGVAPHLSDVAKACREALPEDMKANCPTEVDKATEPPTQPKFDNSPAKTILGINFKETDEMIKDSVKELLANGFTNIKQYVPGSQKKDSDAPAPKSEAVEVVEEEGKTSTGCCFSVK